MITSDYYLSLDDDSFPAAGDFGHAVQFLEAKPDTVGLAFSIISRDEALPSSADTPAPVRYYIGCAHLLKRELFLLLGGYADNWIYSEEPEFCLRALHQSYRVYLYPGVVIQHNRTPVARNLSRTARYYIRNEALVGLRYFPFPYSVLRYFNTLPGILRNPEWNPQWPSLIRGWVEALWCSVRWRRLRRPLPLEQFRAWKKLPLPPQGMSRSRRSLTFVHANSFRSGAVMFSTSFVFVVFKQRALHPRSISAVQMLRATLRQLGVPA